MLEVIQKAADGIAVGGTKVYARNVRACGLKGVSSLEIYLKDGSSEERLLCMAVFPGRKPHYRPWMELFCIKDRLDLKALNGDSCDYYDSAIEDALLETFCSVLGPGGKIFVEYYCDRETSCGLAMGFPPAVTRQGYKLFNLGFTWFKDWYFSEGGHEGGQKLQGEKPLNEAARAKHMRRIKGEVQAFLEGTSGLENTSGSNAEGDELKYLIRARERAKDILKRIDSSDGFFYP